MNGDTRPAITPQLVIGVFFTLLGVVLTLEQFDVIGQRDLQLFWPLALLALGVSLLVSRQDSRGRFWGIFWSAIGTWMFFDRLGIIRVSPGELIVPFVLILLGATLVSRTLGGCQGSRRTPPPIPPMGGLGAPATFTSPPAADSSRPSPVAGLPRSDAGGRVSLFAVMGEAKRASNDTPFRGGELTAVMGGCVLDLRQATIPAGGQAVVNVLAIMAGHEIWVPQGWVVASDVIPILGGMDDKRIPPLSAPAQDAPRLVLKGVVLMGGVTVKG